MDWRATRPVDVARLNSGVFLAVLRKFGAVAAICAPIYFGGIALLAAERAPQLGLGFVLDHIWFAFAALLGHLAFAILVCGFGLTVTSLVCWRHVLARGGPNLVLAALASLARRVVQRLAQRLDTGLHAPPARLRRASPALPDHTLLAQLRLALVVAPDGPPSN